MSKEMRRIQAIANARKRRTARASRDLARTEWFIKEVSTKTRLTMKSRVRLATEFVKNKMIRNISRPVTKTQVRGVQGRSEEGKFTKRKSYTRVTDRSKPGEFPKADTTNLMKTVFSDYKSVPGMDDGFVGTPVDYGVILELSPTMDRRWMVRTLNEERARVMLILSGPLKNIRPMRYRDRT